MQRILPSELQDYDWAQLKPDIDECSDFINWHQGSTPLQQRQTQLVNARLMLTRYEAMLKDKPKNATYQCEVYRYKARVECLELSVQTLS
jgi:hypothetical protein